MLYKFRLRLGAKQVGKFAFKSSFEQCALPDGTQLTLVARNADSLEHATAFHLDCGGFATESWAKSAGEALRTKLRLVNAILGVGLSIPVGDTPSGGVSTQVKQEVLARNAGIVIDSVWGLQTFPDDGNHFEYVMGGNLNVQPSEPGYIFSALKAIWGASVKLDTSSEEALQILVLAGLETSDKAAFLTTYLALEQLINRTKRSTLARELIERFGKDLERASSRKRSPITLAEAQSLRGALNALQEESFSSAFSRLGHSLANPTHIQGIAVKRFISVCISARNNIAHQAEPKSIYPLNQLTAGLRELALGLIWTRNALPTLSFSTPASAISASPGSVKLRAL
ncbi:MAG TPA: hypothetical protein VFC37_11010 [Terracidiphilus sp.]|nr:hypothetical protein [Terracidiphilus sp.]